MCFYGRNLSIICLAMATYLLLLTNLAFAEQYQLKLIIDLSEFNDVTPDAKWLDPLANPDNDGELFIALDNGLIYLAGRNNSIDQQSILNLPLTLNSQSFVSLTAMALHPSFTSPEHPGYATLYTTHTTDFKKEKNNNRLIMHDTNTDFVFPFETVITAWQYDFDRQKIDPQSHREILRVPIKDKNSAISQLTFDPNQKSWNVDYGQLYFSLKYINELKEHPLYSGVVLRIHPLMFGLRNYTVPLGNPFVKNPKIVDEIVVMGGQNIEHFFWAKNNLTSIFIQHNNHEKHLLSQTEIGDNLLTQPKSNVLWQQSAAMSSMLLYQGRDFLSLRNKMVFFTLLNKQWHLTSLALEQLSNGSPIHEELFARDTLSLTSHLNIHQNIHSEIILFDNHKSRLYSLQAIIQDPIEATVLQSSATGDDTESNYYALTFGLVAVLLSVCVFIRRKKIDNKLSIRLLDKFYVRFEYNQSTHTLLLFKPNQNNGNIALALSDISCCEVILNNNVINKIDSQPDNLINNQIETKMRAIFTKEQEDKLINEKTRKIELKLSDKNDSYTIYLYLREGKKRVTRTTYYEAVDILIDLCWIISKQVNPEANEVRLMPVVEPLRPDVTVSAQNTGVVQSENYDNVDDLIRSVDNSKMMSSKPEYQSTQQIEVVDALSKLVNLHQEGYLTGEEFCLAKSRLLQ